MFFSLIQLLNNISYFPPLNYNKKISNIFIYNRVKYKYQVWGFSFVIINY